MIEFTKPTDRVRRVTLFARSDGEFQWNIMEASAFSWTDNWMVTPIHGTDVTSVLLHYPSWLPHVCRGFCTLSPEASHWNPEGTYKRLAEPTKMRTFSDAGMMATELDWQPTESILESGTAWMAVYFPAGRVTLAPWAFQFTKTKEQREHNAIWVPVETSTDDFRVYFQTGAAHGAGTQKWMPKNWLKSQYQACIITSTKQTGPIVAPSEDYYWLQENPRRSEWLNLNT